jgi:hypothetical protein
VEECEWWKSVPLIHQPLAYHACCLITGQSLPAEHEHVQDIPAAMEACGSQRLTSNSTHKDSDRHPPHSWLAPDTCTKLFEPAVSHLQPFPNEFSFCSYPFVYDPASKARVLQVGTGQSLPDCICDCVDT